MELQTKREKHEKEKVKGSLNESQMCRKSLTIKNKKKKTPQVK